MCTTKSRVAVFLLAILIFVSGISMENAGAEHTSAATFVNKENIYTKPADTKLADMHFCTEKLLGTVNVTESQQAFIRCSNKKRETKWSLAFLCVDSFSLHKEENATHEGPVETVYQGPEELVILYIHETDGKKRI